MTIIMWEKKQSHICPTLNEGKSDPKILRQKEKKQEIPSKHECLQIRVEYTSS